MRIIIILFCLIPVIYFSQQFIKQAKIRGWIPGARSSQYLIEAKWEEPGYSYGPTYYLRWNDTEHPDDNTTNVPESHYNSHAVGDPIEVLTVGSSNEPYVHDDIWASNDNIFVTALFVCVSIGIILWQVCRIWRTRDWG